MHASNRNPIRTKKLRQNSHSPEISHHTIHHETTSIAGQDRNQFGRLREAGWGVQTRKRRLEDAATATT